MLGERRLWYLELAALASLAALLVALAVLQYRWLGTLSRREAESQQAAVESALAGARADLDGLLASVQEHLQALAPGGVLDPAAMRRDDLGRLLRAPAVADVFWIGREPPRGGSRALRLGVAGYTPADWSELLQATPEWARSLALHESPPAAPSPRVQWIPAALRLDAAASPGVLLARLDETGLQARIDRSSAGTGVRLRLAGDAGLDITAERSAASIARSVDQLRRRNLLLSGGILSLLAASAGLLWLVSRRAARLSRERLELVAGVSHELRTPVAVIRSAAANLSDGIVAQAADVREYGELIADQARRLQRMVEQALDLSRATRAGGTRRAGSSELLGVVSAAVQRTAASFPDIEVRGLEALTGLPALAVAQDDLEIVVGNLLTNAARYAEDGRWMELDAGISGGRLRFSVTNPAQAPDAGEAARLFQPFYRGRRARELNPEGSGLGLMLVRTICTRYGGDARLQTRPGSITLTVELPV